MCFYGHRIASNIYGSTGFSRKFTLGPNHWYVMFFSAWWNILKCCEISNIYYMYHLMIFHQTIYIHIYPLNDTLFVSQSSACWWLKPPSCWWLFHTPTAHPKGRGRWPWIFQMACKKHQPKCGRIIWKCWENLGKPGKTTTHMKDGSKFWMAIFPPWRWVKIFIFTPRCG